MPMMREPYDESYGSQVLAEAFQPTLPYYFRTYTPHRLAYQASWLWSGIQDEEGTRYACLREWKTEYTLNVLVSKLEDDPGAVASRVYKRLNMGMIDFEMDDGEQAIQVQPPFAPGAFHVEVRPQHYRWKEADGELELEFTGLGPALKYLCPGEREDGLYMSEFCRVAGTFQGKPVKGFGGMDCAFGTPGIGWIQGKIYSRLEKYWIVWANRYDDESIEYGICFDGEGDFNQGFIGIDSSLLEQEKGYQSNDQRHVVKLQATTITPWGIRIGGTALWQSGLPYSIQPRAVSFDFVPDAYLLPTKTPARVRISYPTGVRNSNRNDSQWLFDLKLTKDLDVGRGVNMQLSAEVFNLLNDGTYMVYNPDYEAGFQINGINNARREFGRRWQLGLKLAF